jgi:hypothetical protein
LGFEQAMAVYDCSRREGSHLFLLVTIALHADQDGAWRTDQPTLQRKVRLSRRRVQEILDDLVASGELAVASQRGRGRLSTYRVQVGEKVRPTAHFPEPPEVPEPTEKCAAERAFSAQKGAVERAFSAQKGAAGRAFSPAKGAAERAFSAPLDPPFPPDPHIPLYPPEKQIQETSGLRPLTGPQSAVLRVKLLLEEAAVPLPSPAQIGLWSKTLGGIEPLLELLRGLIQAGLANKREPLGYVHRVVIERAAHPEPKRPPRRAFKTRNPLLLAGSDEVRREQARQITAKVRGKK